MVKPWEKKRVQGIYLDATETAIAIRVDPGYAIFRPGIQELVKELIEWLAETSPEGAPSG